MEDTKKLIEKYKRELMELSRTVKREESPAPARAPRIIGYVDNMDEDKFNELSRSQPQKEGCGDTQSPPEERVFPPAEPRVESEPELPYHHEPETPPPDYTNPPTAAQINAVDEEHMREEALAGSQAVPMPAPIPDTQSIPMPTPSPETQSVPMPTPSPDPQTDPMPSPDVPSVPMPGAEPEIIDELPENRFSEDDSSQQAEEYEPPYADPNMAQNVPGAEPTDDQQARGSQSQPTQFPEPQYSSLEDFQAKNSGRGTMIFRITTAREALPVEGAKCVITKKFGGVVAEIDTLFTDRSGQTPPRTLPAPPKSLSQQYDNLIQPFSLYDATVTRDGYVDVVLTDIPVFDGVQSVQRVSMLPALDGGMFENIPEVNPNAR